MLVREREFFFLFSIKKFTPKCGYLAAAHVFSNFSLLLTKKPLKVPTQMALKFVSWEDKEKVDGEICEDE